MSRVFIFVLSLSVASAALDASPQRGGRAGAPQGQSTSSVPTFTRAQAEVVAARLYEALLGRAGTTAELSRVTAEIQRGALIAQTNTVTGSAEFRRVQQRLNAPQLLEQIYQSFLGRPPDTSGVSGFLPLLEQRRYADVIVAMASSPEFRDRHLAAPVAAAPDRVATAIDCQARVLDAARRDASGPVFLTFDRLPDSSNDGRTVSGPGVDRMVTDRQLTYRCEGGAATYVYADRGRVTGADSRLEFPSGAVRACVGGLRDAGRQVTVDAAALVATDTRTEYVIALAANTQNRYVCEMDGTRVVRVDGP